MLARASSHTPLHTVCLDLWFEHCVEVEIHLLEKEEKIARNYSGWASGTDGSFQKLSKDL